MGAGASTTQPTFSSAIVQEELQKPGDASDVTAENAKDEVIRLRKLLRQQTITEKLGNAAMGSLVGSACAMPLEWFYNREHLKKLIGDTEPNFFPDPSCLFFHSDTEKAKADWTKAHTTLGFDPMYGWTVEKSAFPGYYNFGDMCPSGDYSLMHFAHTAGLDKTKEIADPMALAKLYYDSLQPYKGYRTHALKDFCMHYEGKPHPIKEEEGDDDAKKAEKQKAAEEKAELQKTYPNIGADSTMAECNGKIMPCLTRFGLNEDEEMIMKNLETMVKLMYNCDYGKAIKTTRFYARVILRIARDGKSIKDAVEEVAALPENQEDPENKGSIKFSYDFVKSNLDKNVQDSQHDHGVMMSGNPEKAYISLGCMNPHAFVATISICLKCNTYEEAMRENIMLNGDCSSRAIALGAIYGAAYGVPDDYKNKFNKKDEATKAIQANLA